MFDRHERAHLSNLTGVPLASGAEDSAALPASIQQILDGLDPLPAAVQNSSYDVLAYNTTYSNLIVDLDALPYGERNCLWQAFTNPAWRERFPEWEAGAARMVAQYRAAMADRVAEPSWKCLVGRLKSASPIFAELWERHDVAAPSNYSRLMLHPDLGRFRFTVTSMWLARRLGTRIVVYVPEDEATRHGFERLHAQTRARGRTPRLAGPEPSPCL